MLRPWWWPRLGWRSALLVFAASAVHSQITPGTQTTCVSTFIQGKTFFIIQFNEPTNNPNSAANPIKSDVISINLSVPWSTTNLTTKTLTQLNSTFVPYSTAFAKNGKSVFVFEHKSASIYTMSNNTWESTDLSTTAPGDKPLELKRYAGSAMDPKFGNIFYPMLGNGTSPNGTGIGQIDPAKLLKDKTTGKYVVQKYPGIMAKWDEAYIAWSSAISQLLVFGPTSQAGSRTTWDTMYAWDGVNWNTTKTSGQAPPERYSACMIPVYNGTKLAVFGGTSQDKAGLLSDIFFLDVKTGAWTKDTNAGAGGGRYGMACATTNDYFIVWGGSVPEGEPTANTTIIYNMRTKEWVSEYTPEPYVPPKPTDNSTNPDSGEGTGEDDPDGSGPEDSEKTPSLKKKQPVNLPLVIGITAGGVVVFLNAVGLIVCLARRRSKRRKEERRDYRDRWDDRDRRDRRDRRDDRDGSIEWDDRDYKARSSRRAPSSGRSVRDRLNDGYHDDGYDQDSRDYRSRQEQQEARGGRGYGDDYSNDRPGRRNDYSRRDFDDDYDKRMLRDDYDKLGPHDDYDKPGFHDNYDKRGFQDSYDKRGFRDDYDRSGYRDNHENYVRHADYDSRGHQDYQRAPEPDRFNHEGYDEPVLLSQGSRRAPPDEYEMSMKKGLQNNSQDWKPQLTSSNTRSRWQDDRVDRGANMVEDQNYHTRTHDNSYDNGGMDVRGGAENSSYIMGRTEDMQPTREIGYIDPRSSMRSEVPLPMKTPSQQGREVGQGSFNGSNRGGSTFGGSAGGKNRGHGESTLVSGFNGDRANSSGQIIGGQGSTQRSDFGSSPTENSRRINFTQLQGPLPEEDTTSTQSGSAFDSRYWYQQSSEAALNAVKQPRSTSNSSPVKR